MKYCALYVEAGFEKAVAAEFDGYLPTVDVLKKIRHRKSKKSVWVKTPLFPNYVFVDCEDESNLINALNSPHVFSAVKMGDKYATIDSSKLIANSIDESLLKIGDSVQVTKGNASITGKYVGNGQLKIFFFDREILVSFDPKKSFKGDL